MKILTAPQSGSQAGTTASRNRFGQYLRTRAQPVQPRTPKQTNNRALFTIGTTMWRTEDPANQTAWNNYAAQLTRSDSLGQSYQPTGAELYVGALVASDNGFSAPQTPPDVLPTYVLQVSDVTYTGPAPGPEAFVAAIVTTSTENFAKIETSGPVSAGITSAAAVRQWRTLPLNALNIRPKLYAMTAGTIPILTEYNLLFPSPAAGQVIFFRFTELARPGGGPSAITNKGKQTFRFVAA